MSPKVRNAGRKPVNLGWMVNIPSKNLGEFILEHPKVDKKQFLKWIGQIAKEMESIEIAKGILIYGFLVPFNIIVKESGELALLNLKIKSNQKRLDKMLTNQSIKQFFPEDGSYDDIYSFGKTLQYLLAKAELEPCLTKREEKKFRKIISKCLKSNSKKSYESFEEILSDISSIEEKGIRKRTIMLTICALVLSIIAIFRVVFWKEESVSEKAEAYLETGITYFNVMEDYEKSEEMFEKIKNLEIAEYYYVMAEFMQGKKNITEEEMEEILEEFQKEIGQQLEYDYKYSILKVYDQIDSETAERQVVKLAEEILNSPDWYKNENEVRNILAKRKSL